MCAVGTISSDIGLISGLNINDIVTKLMQIEQRPYNSLKTQNDNLTSQQNALTELTALLYAIKYISDNLGKADLFSKRTVSSSLPNLLSATLTGTPALGTYFFTPLRKAQNNQFLSSGSFSAQEALGGGTLTLRYGEGVQRAASLETLLGGVTFPRGKIRITDRSGAQADIDLTAVQTIDDILEAINAASGIQVRAEAVGDHIRLIDETGQTTSHLIVQEVGSGTTAAALGLAGINVAANVADGQDLVQLRPDVLLNPLNDGHGVYFSDILPDIAYTLRDGTTGEIDLDAIQSGSATVIRQRTLGEVLEKINAAAPDKLRAEIAPDGKRLILTDLTTGEATFQFQSLNDSHAVEDLGLSGEAVDGVITGGRLLGGLKSVLLSRLNGGKGLGELGVLTITDRSGASAAIDLSSAETLEDVIAALNGAGISVQARVNEAKNGIEVLDTSGATNHHLTIASGDATGTAEKLNLAVDEAVESVNSGDLHFQAVGDNTKLADLNGGRGVARGHFRITDSLGNSGVVNLQDQSIQTVGDLLQAIHLLPVQIEAELNDTGDGLVLRDLNQGSLKLKVEDLDSTSAKDLNLAGEGSDVEIEGQSAQVLDGAMTRTLTLAAGDTLENLRDQINQLEMGITAAIMSDGSSRPYHLVLTSESTGRLAQVQLDASASPLSFQEISRAQDALLLSGTGASGLLASSPSNTFTGVLPGVTLDLQDVSDQPITVRVAKSNTDVVTNIKTLIDNYNKFRTKLEEDTAYNSQANERSVLTGDSATYRLDSDLSNLLSGSFLGAGMIQSLAQLGITMKDDGTLTLDQNKLNALLQSNPDAIQQFFTTETTGFSARFSALIEKLAGEGNSLLDQRVKALQETIKHNQERMDNLQVQLDKKQERLLTQFYNMELALAKLQSNLDALSSIQWILDSASNSSNQLFA